MLQNCQTETMAEKNDFKNIKFFVKNLKKFYIHI